MEQIEDGIADHNVLAQPLGEHAAMTPNIEATLTDFVSHVFDHIDGKRMTVGRFLGVEAAETHLRASLLGNSLGES